MKIRWNNKYFRIGLTAFIVIAASISFYYLVFHMDSIKTGLSLLNDIIMPILVGLATAYLLTPVLNYIERKLLNPLFDKCGIRDGRKRRSWIRAIGIFLTAFLFIALIYVLCAMLISQIVPSIANIASNYSIYIKNFTNWITKLLDDNPELGEQVSTLISTYSGELNNWFNNSILTKSSEILKTISVSVINVLVGLWNFIIGFIISIYVLASKEKFAGQAKKIVYAMFEKDTANNIIHDFRFTHRTFIGFIGGKIVDSIIIGVLCFIGTTLLHTPYAALVSVIVGVTNVIPFFGPYLGAIPSAILILVVDVTHPENCLYFVIFILILQQFDGNFLGPKILGNSTGLTGFWVIFAITLFGGLFGILGMVVGVPIFAVIYAAIKSVVNHALLRKNMPVDTAQYLKVGRVEEDGTFVAYEPDDKANMGLHIPKKRVQSAKNYDTAEECATEETPATMEVERNLEEVNIVEEGNIVEETSRAED